MPKAGVMVRQNLEANSPFVAIFSPDGLNTQVIHRYASGEKTKYSVSPAIKPAFFKITKLGSSAKCYASSDGKKWNLLVDIKTSITDNYLLGLAVSSDNPDQPNHTTFSIPVVTKADGTMPSEPQNLNAQAIAFDYVELSWNKPEIAAENYIIERMVGQNAFQMLSTIDGNNFKFSDRTTIANTDYTYRIKAINLSGASAWSNLATVTTPVSQQKPFDTVIKIPGLLKVTNYDIGGEGVAYHDVDASNSDWQFVRSDGVDAGVNGIGWTEPGEWLEYTVDIETTGSYTADILMA